MSWSTLKQVHHLLGMIYSGVRDHDKDCTRSHLEDLNLFLGENNLLAE